MRGTFSMEMSSPPEKRAKRSSETEEEHECRLRKRREAYKCFRKTKTVERKLDTAKRLDSDGESGKH